MPRNLQGGTRARRAGIGNKAPRQAGPMSARSGSGARPVPLTWAPRPEAFPGVRTLSRDGRTLLLQKEALSRAWEPATPGNARGNSRVGRGELAANASPRPSAPGRHRVGGVADPGSSSPQRASLPPQPPSPPLQGPSSPRDSRASQSPARTPPVLGGLTGHQWQKQGSEKKQRAGSHPGGLQTSSEVQNSRRAGARTGARGPPQEPQPEPEASGAGAARAPYIQALERAAAAAKPRPRRPLPSACTAPRPLTPPSPPSKGGAGS